MLCYVLASTGVIWQAAQEVRSTQVPLILPPSTCLRSTHPASGFRTRFPFPWPHHWSRARTCAETWRSWTKTPH